MNVSQYVVDIVDLAKTFKKRDKVHQLPVVHVVEPGGDRDCVVWMEDVRSWRVVDDDYLGEVTAQTSQVFDIVAPVTRVCETAAGESRRLSGPISGHSILLPCSGKFLRPSVKMESTMTAASVSTLSVAYFSATRPQHGHTAWKG